MAKITLDQIKELRTKTGVGIQAVKQALEKSDGDMEKAVVYLREQGIAKAAKRADKATNNGMIGHYIHGNKIGVMVEFLTETDFACSSDKMQELSKNICMHIAAQSPEYISIEDIPEDVIEREKKIYSKDLEGKPDNIKEKILEGKLAKFYEELVLMEQPFVKDEDKKVKDLMNEYIAALGEVVKINRFIRTYLGGDVIVAEQS
jgi:elongation factor Ts